MNLLKKLTIKNLKLNKKRTIVTIIGIMLSVALITAVATMYASGLKSLIVYEKYVKEAINYLKNQHLGSATFFPLNIIKGRSIEIDILNKLKNTKGFIGDNS